MAYTMSRNPAVHMIPGVYRTRRRGLDLLGCIAAHFLGCSAREGGREGGQVREEVGMVGERDEVRRAELRPRCCERRRG
jgi:hypothetical protein